MMSIKKRNILFTLVLTLVSVLTACNYLDVVPDNVATIKDNAFALRSDAKRFLYTCYSYMPDQGSETSNPGFLAGDELSFTDVYDYDAASQIARGNQSVTGPELNYWEGSNGGSDLYEGIRKCNIFLKNVDQVPDMTTTEKKKWSAEVKFLKAYYLFYLVRMYGPVILPKKNTPISAANEGVEEVRSPVDDCFDYIVKLLNEAAPNLPDQIQNKQANLGRITKQIDYAIKAKVLVTAASPLFNGNKDYKGFINKNGDVLFDPKKDPAKWDSAAAAAKKAVDFAKQMGHSLYHFQPTLTDQDLTDTTITKMNIRNSVTERWNSEVIWANTDNSTFNLQNDGCVRGLDPDVTDYQPYGRLGVPLKIAEMFYSNHGVPVKEDKTWDYSKRFDLKTVGPKDQYYLKQNYTTAKLNFNREPRYYADLGFDGSIWYGQGVYDDTPSGSMLYLAAKAGQPAAEQHRGRYSFSGYWPKKLVNYQSVIGDGSYDFNTRSYPWPVIRLSDLYLLYAEAKNEADGPGPQVYKFVNLVRKRAGLESVQDSWTQYSTNPNKYTNKSGMRDIIHRERLIELAFEAKRFWDLRRWKEAIDKMNTPLAGWDENETTAKGYYRRNVVFQQKFITRDYLWPLSENALLTNTKLTQNPGWGR